jgi:N-carbamoylputrescine amidase
MKLTVASIQMESLNGAYDINKGNAEALIREAAGKGAKLISLPEFALAGYCFEDRFWLGAEPLDGPTYRWLSTLCDELGVYVGTCILERLGEDFHCAFILVGPDKQLWIHRKVEAASYEANFFKGVGDNPRVFETPIGKIGVGICFDTTKTYTLASLIKDRPQILLLQFSCPRLPSWIPGLLKRNWDKTYENLSGMYASWLNIPVVLTNKTGGFSSVFPQMFGLPFNSRFADYSAVLNGSGYVLESISGKQGVICTEVELVIRDQPAPRTDIPGGRWCMPYSAVTRILTDYARIAGLVRYSLSSKRKKTARDQVFSGNGEAAV